MKYFDLFKKVSPYIGILWALITLYSGSPENAYKMMVLSIMFLIVNKLDELLEKK